MRVGYEEVQSSVRNRNIPFEVLLKWTKKNNMYLGKSCIITNPVHQNYDNCLSPDDKN